MMAQLQRCAALLQLAPRLQTACAAASAGAWWQTVASYSSQRHPPGDETTDFGGLGFALKEHFLEGWLRGRCQACLFSQQQRRAHTVPHPHGFEASPTKDTYALVGVQASKPLVLLQHNQQVHRSRLHKSSPDEVLVAQPSSPAPRAATTQGAPATTSAASLHLPTCPLPPSFILTSFIEMSHATIRAIRSHIQSANLRPTSCTARSTSHLLMPPRLPPGAPGPEGQPGG